MSTRIGTMLLALVALALIGSIPAASQEKEAEAASLLQAPHKLLGSLAGDFDTATRMWLKPGTDPMESKGSSKRVTLLDGLFLRETYELKETQFAHKGEITWGYNTTTGKVQYVQLTSMAAAMNIYDGTWDEKAKSFTVSTAYKMTYEGVEYDVKTRIVLSVESADKQKLEIFSAYEFKGGSIPEYLETEVKYTRRK